jgi:hypothetical protein
LSSNNTNPDNTWYFGKGIKPHSYLLYKYGSYSVDNNGTMTLGSSEYYFAVYYDHFDNLTSSWSGKVITNQVSPTSINNFTLVPRRAIGDTNLVYNYHENAAGSLTKRQEALDQAARNYNFGVHMLYEYAPYPRSLSDSNWSSVDHPASYAKLNGTKMVTVEAGTFNCTELDVKDGYWEDNKAWINKDLPLPVKGSSYTSSNGTSHHYVKYYSTYRLAAIGNNMPTVAEFPPKTATMVYSMNGQVPVDVSVMPIWTQGGNVRFNLTFFQKGTSMPQAANYDLWILNQTGKVVYKETSYGVYTVPPELQVSKGATSQTTVPDDPTRNIHLENGNYVVRVIVVGVDNNPIDTESVDFPMQVTPELPSMQTGIAALTVALGVIISLRRIRQS